MGDKYYVPDLTEFRVGFRYEIFRNNEWKKTSCYYHTIGTELLITGKDFIYCNPVCRVKCLDESDILELGFKQTNSYSFEKIVDNTTVIIDYVRLKETPYVQIFFVFEGNQTVRFTGRVKNYNELEVILKQIGI